MSKDRRCRPHWLCPDICDTSLPAAPHVALRAVVYLLILKDDETAFTREEMRQSSTASTAKPKQGVLHIATPLFHSTTKFAFLDHWRCVSIFRICRARDPLGNTHVLIAYLHQAPSVCVQGMREETALVTDHFPDTPFVTPISRTIPRLVLRTTGPARTYCHQISDKMSCDCRSRLQIDFANRGFQVVPAPR